MKSRALLALLSLMLPMLSPVLAEDAKPAFVVTYLEVSPDAVKPSRSLLRAYAAAAQKVAGAVQFETFERIGQSNHFAIVESWADAGARETFAASPAAKAFRGKLDPLRIGPYDERAHLALDVVPKAATPASAIVGITHVDFVPDRKDEGVALIKMLVAQSRGQPGSMRFDAWVQASRPNHITLVESWASMAALEKHTTEAATKTFRESLLPMSGSLYDQRLYRVLR